MKKFREEQEMVVWLFLQNVNEKTTATFWLFFEIVNKKTDKTDANPIYAIIDKLNSNTHISI